MISISITRVLDTVYAISAARLEYSQRADSLFNRSNNAALRRLAVHTAAHAALDLLPVLKDTNASTADASNDEMLTFEFKAVPANEGVICAALEALITDGVLEEVAKTIDATLAAEFTIRFSQSLDKIRDLCTSTTAAHIAVIRPYRVADKSA